MTGAVEKAGAPFGGRTGHMALSDAAAQPDAETSYLDAVLLRVYFRNLPFVFAGTSFCLLVMLALLWSALPTVFTVTVMVLQLMIVGVRSYNWRAFNRDGLPFIGDPESFNIQYWRRWAFYGSLLSGAVWAVTAHVAIVETDLAGRMLVIFVIAGLASAATSSISAHLPSFYAFILTAQLTATLTLFSVARGPEEYSMAVLLTFFTATLLFFGGNANLTIRRSLKDTVQEANLRSALSVREEQIRVALENMPAAVAMFDADQRLVMWNRRIITLFPELKPYWREGSHFRELAAQSAAWRHCGGDAAAGGDGEADDAALIEERLARHLSGSAAWEVALPDGRWLQAEETVLPDRVTLTSYSDITGFKQREALARDAKEEAERANLAKSRFLALMSHELRTPLNAILGFADAIKKEAGSAEAAARSVDYATVIHDSGSHLLNVINDILDLSKIEAGKMELSPERLDLQRTLQSVLRILQGQADAASLTMRAMVEPGLTEITADQRAVHQILLNLISNAIKFTGPGGTVSVEAGRQGAFIALRVRDTGVGIEADMIPAVLEPFSQIDNSLARRSQGTGLGVPLTKSLAELHGGRLEIESAPGTGSTFTVLLPVLQSEAGAPAGTDETRAKMVPSGG